MKRPLRKCSLCSHYETRNSICVNCKKTLNKMAKDGKCVKSEESE